MRTRITASLIVLIMVLSLAVGCSPTAEEIQETSSQQQAVEASPAASESKPVQTEEQPAAETEQATVTYPLEDNPTFSIIYRKASLLQMVLGEEDYDFSLVYDEMQQRTGVTIEWRAIAEAAWDTQISLIIAGGDYPDAFSNMSGLEFSSGNVGLIDEDVLLDLAPFLAENAPDYNRLIQENEGFASNVVESNGYVPYFVSSGSEVVNQGTQIRSDWLDALNLDIPTTTDELVDVLLACKAEYGLAAPLLVTAKMECGLNYAYNVIFEGERMSYQLNDDASAVVWSGDTQSSRDYIAFLRSLYEQGIFDDSFLGVSNELGNVESSYLDGSKAVWFYGSNGITEEYKQRVGYDAVAIADIKLNSDDGISGITQAQYTFTTVMGLFNTCKEPELLCRFLNYFYTDEGVILANWGVEDETFYYDAGNNLRYTDIVLSDSDCFMFMLRSAKYGIYWAPTKFDMDLINADATDEQLEAIALWQSCRGSYLALPANLSLTAAQRETIGQYENDCSTYYWENVYKVIIGQTDMEDLDQIIENTLNMGAETIVQEYNNAYDAYLKDITA